MVVPLSFLVAGPGLALPPPDADVVFVRDDCTVFVDPTVCVETMADINTWVADPLRTAPRVLIDVGPGDWGPFVCNGETGLSIRGAGRETTRLIRTNDTQQGGMDFTNCEADVESLTSKGPFAGVTWFQGGSSTWSDVDMIGGGTEIPRGLNGTIFSFGWYDRGGLQCAEQALHYFFGSRARALGNAIINVGYQMKCSEVWFYGGEIQATHEADVGASNQAAIQIVDSNGVGDFRVFGSAIRSQVGAGVNVPIAGTSDPEMTGVDARAGLFHMHGGIISVSAGGSARTIGALGLSTGSGTTQAHTPGTAFVVAAANGGTSTRVRGPHAVTQSPFLWQQGSEPPRSVPGDATSAFVSSIQGADLFVETDCSSSSCSGGSDPHLMIYSESCSASGPWFDAVTGACRN